jgi:NDP-sugar pyrophosphorylase family protein
MVRPCSHPHPFAFCGIHVISPRLLRLMREHGAFSIIDVYLRLAGAGEKIRCFRADEYYWRDLGRPEHLAQAAADVATGALVLS